MASAVPLASGLEAAFLYVVTGADTAVAVGSGEVPGAAVAGALEPGATTVGSRGELDHLAPSPVGAELSVRAVLERVEGRRLVFAVRVADGDRLVARGLVTRVVVDTAAFARDAGGGPTT